MRLLLARHGNTFLPKEVVTYVGRGQDVPLAPHGIEQAHRLADALATHALRPQAIFCGPLMRLRQTAAVVAERLRLTEAQIYTEACLDELDYGMWSGRTREQVGHAWGTAVLEAWEHEGRPPEGTGWAPDAALGRQQVQNFVQDLQSRFCGEAPVLAISSNGRLRLFLHCVPGAFAQQVQKNALKVRCGCVSALDVGSRLICWDQLPAQGIGLAQAVWQNTGEAFLK